jgi:hypothetical protein
MSDVLAVCHANVILKQINKIQVPLLLVLSTLYKVGRKEPISRGKLLIKFRTSLEVFQVKQSHVNYDRCY